MSLSVSGHIAVISEKPELVKDWNYISHIHFTAASRNRSYYPSQQRKITTIKVLLIVPIKKKEDYIALIRRKNVLFIEHGELIIEDRVAYIRVEAEHLIPMIPPKWPQEVEAQRNATG